MCGNIISKANPGTPSGMRTIVLNDYCISPGDYLPLMIALQKAVALFMNTINCACGAAECQSGYIKCIHTRLHNVVRCV